MRLGNRLRIQFKVMIAITRHEILKSKPSFLLSFQNKIFPDWKYSLKNDWLSCAKPAYSLLKTLFKKPFKFGTSFGCKEIVSRSQTKTKNQFLALSLKFTIMSTLHLNINYYVCCESHLYDNDEWEGTADKLHFV